MLSTGSPIAAGRSGEYYRVMAGSGDHAGHGQTPARRLGEGTIARKLAGQIHRRIFEDLLANYPPAFASPQLLAKIEAAHRVALEMALTYLESNAGLTRRRA